MQVMITSIKESKSKWQREASASSPCLSTCFVQTCKKMRPMPLSSCTLCSGSYWMME